MLPLSSYLDAKLDEESNFVETLAYSEAKSKGHFISDYDRKNPILKSNAISKYIEFMRSIKQTV